MLIGEMQGKYRYNPGGAVSIILILWLLGVSCSNNKSYKETDRAFYYWKSVFRLSQSELKLAYTLRVKTLYVKYFDVDWDDDRSLAIPKANLRVQQQVPENLKIVPCIFITNACIAKIDSAGIEELSTRLMGLVNAINEDFNLRRNEEIQIDCDWTATTKQKYFYLLKLLRKDQQAFTSTKFATWSCTIRLHQIKFLQRTGIPPVDRGMLMIYNMGNLKNPATKNSILETDELKKYLGNLYAYPLKLDIALPAFNWTVLFRENKYAGLIRESAGNLLTNSAIRKTGDNRFIVLKDTTIENYEFIKGDILREEKSEYKEILQALQLTLNHLPEGRMRLALYHLDSLTLSKYTVYEMENIFRGYN